MAKTLKFRIVVLAMLTALLSAAGTAYVAPQRIEGRIEKVVLASARDDRERVASMLGSQAAVLQDALAAVARHVPAEGWREPSEIWHYLLDNPALASLFNSVFAANAEGQILACVDGGRLA